MAISGCSRPIAQPPPSALLALAAAPMPAPEPDYRIEIGDQLDLKFFYNAELNEQVIVRPDGRIALQLVGEIVAVGLTPSELSAQLVNKYSQELRRPAVTVIVRSFNGRSIYVDGEVNRAGSVTFMRPPTVLQAISQAGGMKETAAADRIYLIRRGADNRPLILPIDAARLRTGDQREDVVLRALDIVYVPRSTIADVNVWVDQYIRRNIPIPFSIQYGVP